MARAEEESSKFLLNLAAVHEAWHALCSANVHVHFLGYMCLLEAAVAQGKTHGLRPAFKRFFDRYFAAAGMSESHPYLHPFARPPTQYKNVAGSYAPSSLRDVAPLREVAELSNDRTWALRNSHAAVARKVMLHEQPLPGLAFATFLYRDYGFSKDSATPDGLEGIFRSEFGLGSDTEYGALFGARFKPVDDLFGEANAHE